VTDTGLLSLLGFCALMVGAAFLIAWGYKRSNARADQLEDERIKREGQSWSN
jgi:Tfp pilus assembly protein PilN